MTRCRKHMRGYRYEARPGALQARRRTPKVLVVLVLEARDRLGGRCHSLVDESGVAVELGEAVLMGVQGHNSLAALCRRLGAGCIAWSQSVLFMTPSWGARCRRIWMRGWRPCSTRRWRPPPPPHAPQN
eukprot:scaffold2992_cov101-Isochrysis_galbana.AAC.2